MTSTDAGETWNEMPIDFNPYHQKFGDINTYDDSLYLSINDYGYFKRGILRTTGAEAARSAVPRSMEVCCYPNPAESRIHLVLEGGVDGAATVVVRNILGRETMRAVVELRNGSAFLDVRGVPDGAYVLSVDAGGVRRYGRFMKMYN
jgi:hypothetical protein